MLKYFNCEGLHCTYDINLTLKVLYSNLNSDSITSPNVMPVQGQKRFTTFVPMCIFIDQIIPTPQGASLLVLHILCTETEIIIVNST